MESKFKSSIEVIRMTGADSVNVAEVGCHVFSGKTQVAYLLDYYC